MSSGQRNKVVFILGAGFSAGANAPLIDNFISRAREFYANQSYRLSSFEKELFGKVFKYRDEFGRAGLRVKIDIDNIEELFSLLDMNCTYDSAPELIETRNALIYLIIKTLDLSIDNLQPYIWFVEKLLSLKYSQDREFDFSFVSFNYDLILERIFEQGQCAYDYCTEVGNEKDAYKVLKLHGSANWLACTQCGGFKVYNQKVLIPLYSANCSNCGIKTPPLIIPPTWNKTINSPHIRNVWNVALKQLQEATEIVVVGYSFPSTDVYFRHILALALLNNINLRKIIVLNPDSQVDTKFTDLLDTNFSRRCYKFLKGKFTDLIPRVFDLVTE